MSQQLQTARQYHKAIREFLLKEWDPIGVGEIPEAQDEYDYYIPHIYGLIIRREPVEKIFDYLWWTESKNMELCGNRKRTESVAGKFAELAKATS